MSLAHRRTAFKGIGVRVLNELQQRQRGLDIEYTTTISNQAPLQGGGGGQIPLTTYSQMSLGLPPPTYNLRYPNNVFVISLHYCSWCFQLVLNTYSFLSLSLRSPLLIRLSMCISATCSLCTWPFLTVQHSDPKSSADLTIVQYIISLFNFMSTRLLQAATSPTCLQFDRTSSIWSPTIQRLEVFCLDVNSLTLSSVLVTQNSQFKRFNTRVHTGYVSCR